jgi:hypothetical protein
VNKTERTENVIVQSVNIINQSVNIVSQTENITRQTKNIDEQPENVSEQPANSNERSEEINLPYRLNHTQTCNLQPETLKLKRSLSLTFLTLCRKKSSFFY